MIGFVEWLAIGREQGWVSATWCWVHDSPPLTEEEEAEIEAADGDMDVICVHVMRVL